MSIQTAATQLAQLCVEQQLHYTETMDWVKQQCRQGDWLGLNPHEVVAGAREELSSTAWL